MMGTTHVVVGATAGAWLAAGLSLVVPDGVALMVIPVVAYAALLPDIDHRRSAVTYSLGPVTMLASFAVRFFVTHRGATHAPVHAPVWFGILAALAALALPSRLAAWWWVWALAVAVGVASHIWADARTVSGVPWQGGRATIGRPFRTGSKREKRLAAMVYRPAALVSIAGAMAVAVYA